MHTPLVHKNARAHTQVNNNMLPFPSHSAPLPYPSSSSAPRLAI